MYTQQTRHADVVWIFILDKVFGAGGVRNRSVELFGNCDQ